MAIVILPIFNLICSILLTIERSDVEQQQNDIVNRINKDKYHMLHYEDNILKLLFESKGNILDDEGLVDAINETKEAMVTTIVRLAETQETECGIFAIREKYRPVAIRAAALFFIIARLSRINSIYQFSLQEYISIYRRVISEQRVDSKIDADCRITFMTNEMSSQLYNHICKVLFQRDKPVLGFLLAVAIEKSLGNATDGDIEAILRGWRKTDQSRIGIDLQGCCKVLNKIHPELASKLSELQQIARLTIGNVELVSSCMIYKWIFLYLPSLIGTGRRIGELKL